MHVCIWHCCHEGSRLLSTDQTRIHSRRNHHNFLWFLSFHTRGEGHIVLLTLFKYGLVHPVCLWPVFFFVSALTHDALIDKVKRSHTLSHMMSPRQTQELNTVYSVASLCSVFACLVNSEETTRFYNFAKMMFCREGAEACVLLFTHINFNNKTHNFVTQKSKWQKFLASHRACGRG